MNHKIVEMDDDAWTVTPIAGYVLKWKEVSLHGGEKHKCFVNVCHCAEMPPPIDDLDEDELAARLDKGDTSYRIPLSIGELDCVKDNKSENSVKIDVVVNSDFFFSKLDQKQATFYRHFFAMVACDSIQNKHGIELDPLSAIALQNRSSMGELMTIRIRKRPEKAVVQEVDTSQQQQDSQFPRTSIGVDAENDGTVDDRKEEALKKLYGVCNPEGLRMRLFDGKRLEMNMCLSSVQPPIDSSRLRVKLTPTRVLVLLDRSRSLYDFGLPFLVDPKTAKSKLVANKGDVNCCLILSIDVVFPR